MSTIVAIYGSGRFHTRHDPKNQSITSNRNDNSVNHQRVFESLTGFGLKDDGVGLVFYYAPGQRYDPSQYKKDLEQLIPGGSPSPRVFILNLSETTAPAPYDLTEENLREILPPNFDLNRVFFATGSGGDHSQIIRLLNVRGTQISHLTESI